MAQPDVGEGARLAAATGAWICFEDESGQALQPPKARTWGRRGRTPVARVSGRGSGRISVAGLACMKAGQPGRFFYRMQGHRLRPGTRRAMSEADYAGLITAAHRYLGAPVIVIWDNLSTHLSRKMRALHHRPPGLADGDPAAGLRSRPQSGRDGVALVRAP